MERSMPQPVYVSTFDHGVRTSISATWDGSWRALLEGRRNFSSPNPPIEGWPDDFPTAMLADWPGGTDPDDRAQGLARQLGQDTRAVHASLLSGPRPAKVTVILASSHGESYAASRFAEHLANPSTPLSESVAQAVLEDRLAAAFLSGLGTTSPAMALAAACASGSVALGWAARRVRSGMCDVCIVVALDVISRVAHAGFRQIGALSRAGCRPFDRSRDGTTIAEAGAVLVVSSRPPNPSSGVRATAELAGFGQSCDARHPVEPSLEGVCHAMHQALADARCAPSDLCGVYWHGTGTLQNDRIEAAAAESLFQRRVPPGTSSKGAFGHAMGASAALSVAAAIETIASGLMPPVASLENPEYPDMNLVMGTARRITPGPVAVMALGFGGLNAALVIRPM